MATYRTTLHPVTWFFLGWTVCGLVHMYLIRS